MKKAILFAVLLIANVVCRAQDFIGNPDYVYGIGVSADGYSADSLAMLSLSRSIYTDIRNESTYTVEEDGSTVSEKYSKSVSLKANIKIRGARKIVELTPDGFRVTYYFNKTEYVDTHLRDYGEKLMEAYEYENSDEPHSVNRMLGSLYLAYVAVNDTLLNILSDESVVYRDDALEKIRGVLEYTGGYLLSAREGRNEGWKEVRDETGTEPVLPLPGFEYINRYGKWDVPDSFYGADRKRYSGTDMNGRIWAAINTRGKKYRLTFEKAVGNTYVRINVPEWFYALVDPVGRCEKTFI